MDGTKKGKLQVDIDDQESERKCLKIRGLAEHSGKDEAEGTMYGRRYSSDAAE